MSPKTLFFISLLILALLLLATYHWLTTGAKALAGQTKQSPLRPHFT